MNREDMWLKFKKDIESGKRIIIPNLYLTINPGIATVNHGAIAFTCLLNRYGYKGLDANQK